MADLTVIIMTFNEEKNIGNCISAIKPVANRILVVDSYSSDNTCKIAKELGAELVFKSCNSLSEKFEFALKNCDIKTTWVMRLDADEYFHEDSAEELEKLCNENQNNDVNGIVLRFENMFLGRPIRHGGMYPFYKMACFKNGFAQIEQRHQDEHIYITSGRLVTMKKDITHYDYKGLTQYINKHNWYSSMEVKDYIASLNANQNNEHLEKKARKKRKVKYNIYYKLPIGFRAKLYYWYRLIFKLGFLDGKEGRIYLFLQAYWYRYLVDAKIYAYKKLNEEE